MSAVAAHSSIGNRLSRQLDAKWDQDSKVSVCAQCSLSSSPTMSSRQQNMARHTLVDAHICFLLGGPKGSPTCHPGAQDLKLSRHQNTSAA